MFFGQPCCRYATAFGTDLALTAAAAGLLPEDQGLQRRQCRNPAKFPHGVQEIHQYDNGLGEMTVDRRPAAIKAVRLVPVRGTADIDEVADAHQAALGELRKHAGE